LRLSPDIAASLAHPDLFSRTAGKLSTKKAVVRVNLLRIIMSICDAHTDHGALLPRFGLFDAVHRLAETDPAILVREMASELLRSSEIAVGRGRRSFDGGAVRRSVLRRSSSSHFGPSTPTGLGAGSLPGTPNSQSFSRNGGLNGYFDAVIETSASSIARNSRAGTPYRPVSRDGNSGGGYGNSAAVVATRNGSSNGTRRSGSGDSASSVSTTGTGPGSVKSRLPVTTATPRQAGSRRSIAPASSVTGLRERKDENSTPTHNPRETNRVVVNQRRQRRQTSSGAETSRWAS
jgi:hypothetical protein